MKIIGKLDLYNYFVNFLKKTLQMLLLKYHRSYPISKNSSRYKFAFPFVFYIYKKYKHCLSVLDIKK